VENSLLHMKLIGVSIQKRLQNRGSVSCHGALQHPLTGAFPSRAKQIKDAGVYPDYLFIKPGSQHTGTLWSMAIRAACYIYVAIHVRSPEKMMILRGNIRATGID
jgi:hypothetical protein